MGVSQPRTAGPYERVGNPNGQLDCAMADLAQAVEAGPVALYVYVHGWHHNASHDDCDVRKFASVLSRYAKLSSRRVIGVFVGWNGETVKMPLVSHLTFVARKNAAERVAGGRVRELFARVKGLRQHWNAGERGGDCARPRLNRNDMTDPCRLRVVMMGHSFGGLILYSATEPYLLETLATPLDLPADADRYGQPRSKGIADLIILLNPAFEAARFEPLYRVGAWDYTGPAGMPLLVSLTSEADFATRRLFPLARNVMAMFQYPPNSELQREALHDTIGNVAHYVTHTLCAVGAEGSCEQVPKQANGVPPLSVCGQMELRVHADKSGKPLPIWNVVTYGDVIADHNAIDSSRTLNFFELVYARITDTPPCLGEGEPIGERRPGSTMVGRAAPGVDAPTRQ
jgi:hypothetical protein